MKNRIFSISLISLLVIFAAANAILFLVIPDANFDLASFWIAWFFSFPLCLLTTLVVTFYCAKTSNITLVKVPLLFTIQYSFVIVYLIAGIILMSLGLENITSALVTEISITAVYLVLVLYAWSTISYLNDNIKRARKKVFYIRSLQSDIDNCIPKVSDPKLSQQLVDLASKIRFSDPMSHKSLRDSEQKLQDLVYKITTNISNGEFDDIPSLINETSIELDYRNNKCKILK
ncbi:MAG: hypothetical protein E7596_02895 [Ruminococcaceae bacterium]|nr:hypothetical protein [Oscillospiraceae bacterium]